MKANIINEIIKHQKDLISLIEKEKLNFRESADIDEEDVLDPEDLSHQTENKEMEILMNRQLVHAKQDLMLINELDKSVHDKIQAGSLVYTSDQIFFIGVATIPFQYEGHTVFGISTAAPIYPFLKGKKAGERIKYPSKDCLIEKVE